MNKIVLGLVVLGALTILFALGAVKPFAAGTNDNNTIDFSNELQDGEVQEVSVKALSTGGYDKPEIRVKKGIPVKFSFSAEPRSGCGQLLVIPDFNVQLVSKSGQTVSATFTPTKTGTYAYRCGMNMFRGRMIVE